MILKNKIAQEKKAAEKAAQEKVEAEKAAQEKIVAEKAAADKIANEKLADENSKKQTGIITPINTGAEAGDGKIGSKDAKHAVLQSIGGENKYRENIKRGDELFKMKRYAEAKPVYEEALKIKANDPYATNKLAEIEKLIKK